MKPRSVPDNTRNTGHVLRVGLLTYSGVSLLTMFAATFVSVTVYPSIRWSLRVRIPDNLPRAFIASSVTGVTLALIIMAGITLIRRLEEMQR